MRPLPAPKAVSCFYFRNKNGRLLGELEPYFVLSPDEMFSDPKDYWQEWEKNLPRFHMIDVDASNHMMLLSEPKVRDTILSFCERLYSEKGMSPQFLIAFKRKTKKIHGNLVECGTNNKPTKKTVEKSQSTKITTDKKVTQKA